MWSNPQVTVDLVAFTEEIVKGKLHFCALPHCSDAFIVDLTYFTHGFHACFIYFTYISHVDASLWTLTK